SSPHALACGGTRLSSSAAQGIASEVVWNDGAQGGASGGGVSQVFALPTWPAMPIRKRVTRCASTARIWSSGAPAPWPPCGQRSLQGSANPAAAQRACGIRSCTPRPQPCATLPRATTAIIRRGRAGMVAPASAVPTARNWPACSAREDGYPCAPGPAALEPLSSADDRGARDHLDPGWPGSDDRGLDRPGPAKCGDTVALGQR